MIWIINDKLKNALPDISDSAFFCGIYWSQSLVKTLPLPAGRYALLVQDFQFLQIFGLKLEVQS